MKKVFPIILCCCISVFATFAQTPILTANAFFQTISETYSTIKDYEADVVITANSVEMTGKVSFKRPNLLRIDFSNPDTQVIVFNGEQLTIYLPGPQAILNQSVTQADSSQTGATLATPQGLSLMSRYYSIAYETGQDPVPIEEESDEMVVKLVLTRKSASEGFQTIILSISPDTGLIRKVEATTPQNEIFIFLFSNYVLNQSISDQRFLYDAPSSANNYNNFCFSE